MTPPEAPILAAEHLSRSVGAKTIVSDVSFQVRRGELLAIVGPSGSGKSSLLRLLNRLDEPTSGTVFVEGVDYRTIQPRELRRRVGMVMQQPVLFPGTVAANIRFGPAQRHEVIADQTLSALLDHVGLPGFADRSVDKLSGGEAQRVAIARTLVNRPCVVLMDEATSSLDVDSKRQIEALIARIIGERHLTCLLVTHDPAQAARIADRVLVLEHGAVRAIGSPAEVLA